MKLQEEIRDYKQALQNLADIDLDLVLEELDYEKADRISIYGACDYPNLEKSGDIAALQTLIDKYEALFSGNSPYKVYKEFEYFEILEAMEKYLPEGERNNDNAWEVFLSLVIDNPDNDTMIKYDISEMKYGDVLEEWEKKNRTLIKFGITENIFYKALRDLGVDENDEKILICFCW